jgi:hypothetical protein
MERYKLLQLLVNAGIGASGKVFITASPPGTEICMLLRGTDRFCCCHCLKTVCVALLSSIRTSQFWESKLG